MNIINTATVVASEPLLRSLTVDPESAQALPPMGISAPPDCGIKAPRKHAGSAACRPLGSAKAARRPPAGEDTSLPSFLGDAAPEPCGDECHLAEQAASPVVKPARWSMTEEVVFRKAKKMWSSCCRIAAVLRKPCREVRAQHTRFTLTRFRQSGGQVHARLESDPDHAAMQKSAPLSKTALLKAHEKVRPVLWSTTAVNHM